MNKTEIACGLPAAPAAPHTHIAPPAPCPAVCCDEPVQILPYIPPCAIPPPPHLCGTLETGCNWTGTCEPSIPPAIGCAPVVTGWGAFDGGVPHWARSGFCNTDHCKVDPTRPDYMPEDWNSFLDFNTSDSFWTNLTIMRNNQPNKITASEFINMAHKIAQLLVGAGVVLPPSQAPVPAQFGLSLVKTGMDATNKPLYGLSTTYAGQPVGSAMNLVTERNAQGVVVGIRFPHELAVAQEA